MTQLESSLQMVRQTAIQTMHDNPLLHIDDVVCRQFADTVIAKFPEGAALNPIALHSRLNEAQKICLTLLHSVINYCYVNPQSGKDYRYQSATGLVLRSSGFLQALIDAPIDWSNLVAVTKITPDAWNKLLQLDDKNVLYQSSERLDVMRTFAHYLQETIDPENFLKDFNSYDRLYELLNGTGLFKDVFLKRLQLVFTWIRDIALVYHRPFEESAITTAMADYRVPQVLYNTGVVALSPDAKEQLQGRFVARDSALEVSLRSAAIVACLRLSELTGLSESEIDRRIWMMSQEMLREDKLPIPAMCVPTDCY